MRAPVLLAVLLMAGTLLSGCSSDGGPDDEDAATDSLPAQLAANLGPAPAWDAKAGLDWWADFVKAYTLRNTFLPANQEATDRIATDMQAAGFDVQVLQYGVCSPNLTSRVPVVCMPTAAGPAEVNVVAALRKGTDDPAQAIALGGHYDNVYTPFAAAGGAKGTLEAAYDNGSGTAMVYNTCKQLAQVPLNKSLLCLFFSGEEEGVLGSSAYVNAPPAGSPTIDFYLGYDMVGINWPGPVWKLYNWVQAEFADDLHPFVNETVTDVLGWPAEGAEVFAFNDRNSDELSFINAGIPSIRFAGGRTAGAYPAYHELNDTVEFVDAFVGGRGNYALGFGAILEESTLLVRLLDQTSLAEIQDWAGGGDVQ